MLLVREVAHEERHLQRVVHTGRAQPHADVGEPFFPVALVVERRDLGWLTFLLDKGADPNLADNKGVTPLLLACRLRFLDGVERLVKGGARVDEPNETGETPLISAVHDRNIPLMRTLLKAGANPDRTDNTGRSARDYAKQDGAGNALLAEIEQNAKPTSSRSGSGSYGPTL